jgi:hypothetical protein
MCKMSSTFSDNEVFSVLITVVEERLGGVSSLTRIRSREDQFIDKEILKIDGGRMQNSKECFARRFQESHSRLHAPAGRAAQHHTAQIRFDPVFNVTSF